jgi:Ca2+-binding EF-hand superfamily protein
LLALAEFSCDAETPNIAQALRPAFERLDVSGDGRLDLKELRLLLRTVGREMTDLQVMT